MVEGCEFVGSCEDVDGGFVLLSCVKMRWWRQETGGMIIPWVRRRIYLHQRLTINLPGAEKYFEYQRRAQRVEGAD